MKYTAIVYRKEGNVAYITLNQPERGNAWDFPGQGGMYDQFYDALGDAEEDDEIKVVVIKGAGRGFSFGGDLEKMGWVYGFGKPGERRPSQRARLKVDRRWQEGNLRLFYCSKITVAQVHGHCYGQGLGIVLLCDVSIAAENARIGDITARLGFAGSGFWYTPALILSMGLKRARDFILTGRIIDGVEAERLGIVSRVVPEDSLDEEVDKVVKSLLLLPKDGIAMGKAFTQLVYDRFGLTAGFYTGYIGHSMFTNLRTEPGELNLFKERMEKGTKAAMKRVVDRYNEVPK